MLPAEQQRRDGLAVVDKEAGWTSHDVVAKARGLLRNRKIGHSGTLDPDATGVLLLGVGRVTRLLRFLTALPKSYVGEIVLGTETTTLDASGVVTAVHDMGGVTLSDVQRAAAGLTGEIRQVPPMVSAVHHEGRRLHEIAREGREVPREPRAVTVWRFDVFPVPGEPGVFTADLDCSSGTYVRSLAADLGRALGGGAHLRSLRRTAIGSFTLTDARPLDDLLVLSPADAMRDLPSVVVDDVVAQAVGHGKVLEVDLAGLHGDLQGAGPWAVLDRHGDLLAVYESHRPGLVKPAVVVAPAGPESDSRQAQG